MKDSSTPWAGVDSSWRVSAWPFARRRLVEVGQVVEEDVCETCKAEKGVDGGSIRDDEIEAIACAIGDRGRLLMVSQ